MTKPIPNTSERLDRAIESALAIYREHQTVSWVLYAYNAHGEVEAYALPSLPSNAGEQRALTSLLRNEGIMAYAISVMSELRVVNPADGSERLDKAIISATATAEDFEVAIHVIATDRDRDPSTPVLAFRSGHAHEGPNRPRDPAKSITVVYPPWMTRLLVPEQ